MRLLFMGTPDFSIPILDSLHNSFDLVAVYTQPPNRKGRGKRVRYTPVHQRSLDLGIPVETPISLKNSDELCVSLVELFTENKPKNSENIKKIDNYGQNIFNNVILELKKYI